MCLGYTDMQTAQKTKEQWTNVGKHSNINKNLLNMFLITSSTLLFSAITICISICMCILGETLCGKLLS